MSTKVLRRLSHQPPPGLDPAWLHEAVTCKEDAMLLSEVRRRVDAATCIVA